MAFISKGFIGAYTQDTYLGISYWPRKLASIVLHRHRKVNWVDNRQRKIKIEKKLKKKNNYIIVQQTEEINYLRP